MDIKESIISSFFFHLILFLIIMAAANYTAGFSSGTRNIVTVDFAMKDSQDQPKARSNSADEPPRDFTPPSDGKMELQDQAAANLPEESKIVPEPQMKPESAVQPAKTEKPDQPSIRTEGFPSLEAYYQFIILHKKIFGQQAGVRINELLGEAFKVNKREFYGGTAVVSLEFGTDGKIKAVLVDSESPDLKAFLEEIGWGVIPAPAAYSLGLNRVQIEFTVREGYMSFTINTL